MRTISIRITTICNDNLNNNDTWRVSGGAVPYIVFLHYLVTSSVISSHCHVMRCRLIQNTKVLSLSQEKLRWITRPSPPTLARGSLHGAQGESLVPPYTRGLVSLALALIAVAVLILLLLRLSLLWPPQPRLAGELPTRRG